MACIYAETIGDDDTWRGKQPAASAIPRLAAHPSCARPALGEPKDDEVEPAVNVSVSNDTLTAIAVSTVGLSPCADEGRQVPATITMNNAIGHGYRAETQPGDGTCGQVPIQTDDHARSRSSASTASSSLSVRSSAPGPPPAHATSAVEVGTPGSPANRPRHSPSAPPSLKGHFGDDHDVNLELNRYPINPIYSISGSPVCLCAPAKDK